MLLLGSVIRALLDVFNWATASAATVPNRRNKRNKSRMQHVTMMVLSVGFSFIDPSNNSKREK